MDAITIWTVYFYSIARGELNETLARLIDAKVLDYIDQSGFEELYHLIRKTEQSLNGFMSSVRRQRAGSQEFGDKVIHEDQAKYEFEMYAEPDNQE